MNMKKMETLFLIMKFFESLEISKNLTDKKNPNVPLLRFRVIKFL